jgi:hypothetical protein
MGFRNGLIEASRELAKRLIEVYAELSGANEGPLREELISIIKDRVRAFIRSSVAGQHGSRAASAMHQGTQLIAAFEMGIGGSFDLAVYDVAKRQRLADTSPQASLVPAPSSTDDASPTQSQRTKR